MTPPVAQESTDTTSPPQSPKVQEDDEAGDVWSSVFNELLKLQNRRKKRKQTSIAPRKMNLLQL